MRSFLKTSANAFMVVGGFLTVFFGVSRIPGLINEDTVADPSLNFGVAYADAPSCGDSGDSGGSSCGSDSGGGDCGGDGGK